MVFFFFVNRIAGLIKVNVGKIGDFALSDVVKKLFNVDGNVDFHWNNIQNELGGIINAIIPTNHD